MPQHHQQLSSSQQAFAVPEITELILSMLPQLQLFRVQRVCRHWFRVIRASIKLQRLMFCADGPSTVSTTTASPSIFLNPFFLSVVDPLLVGDGLASLTDWPNPTWAHPGATWRKTLLFTPGAANASVEAHFAGQQTVFLGLPVRRHKRGNITLEDFLAMAWKVPMVGRKFRLDRLVRVVIRVNGGSLLWCLERCSVCRSWRPWKHANEH